MTGWHDALRHYRRIPLEGGLAKNPRRVMFVLCSESYAAAAVAAACEPALVHQAFGGARNPGDEATRATFEYAILKKGVRDVVVCGHDGCQAVTTHGADSRRATRSAVVSQCVGLREDEHIGPLLREHRVALRPIWFDAPEGDIFLCNLENEAVKLMGDDDFATMIGAEGSERRAHPLS